MCVCVGKATAAVESGVLVIQEKEEKKKTRLFKSTLASMSQVGPQRGAREAITRQSLRPACSPDARAWW